MPEEVNIDDLLDLPNEEERVKKLQVNMTCFIYRYLFNFGMR